MILSRKMLVVVLLAGAGCRKEPPPEPSAPGAEVPVEAPPPAEPTPTAPAAPVQRVDREPDAAPVAVIDRLRTGDAVSLTLSRGGRWALADVGRGVVQVFDASSGRLVLERDFWPWTPCTYRPFASNGRRVLVRSADAVRLVNLWTGEVVADLALAGEGQVACTLSGDGTRAVVARGARASIRDAGGVRPPVDVDLPPDVSPDVVLADDTARTLVVAGRGAEGPVGFVWGGEGGRRWRKLQGFDGAWPLVMSGTGEWLAGPRGAGSALWRLWTGDVGKSWSWPRVHAFAAHGARALVEGRGGALSMVEIETDATLSTLPPTPGLRAAAIESDGQRVTIASGDRDEHRLAAWSLEDGQARFTRSDPRRAVSGVAWSAGGDRLRIDGGRGLSLSLDTATGACTSGASRAADGYRYGVHWAGRFVPAHRGKDVVVSDSGRGGVAWSHRAAARVRTVAGDAEGSRVVVLTVDGVIAVHGAADGSAQTSFAPAGEVRPVALVTHPTRGEVLVALSDGALAARSLVDGREVKRWVIDPAVGRARRVAVSPDGATAAVAGDEGISVIALDAGGAKALPLIPSRVTALAVSPGGARVAVSDGADVTLWEPESGALVATVSPVEACAVVVVADHGVCGDAARASLRWRRGVDLMPRGTPEAEAVWRAWRLPATAL